MVERATRFELVTFSLARRRSTAELCPHDIHQKWSRCQDPDSNWGHLHFQCSALPTELSRQVIIFLSNARGILSKGLKTVKFSCEISQKQVNFYVGVVVSRWMPQSSKLVAGCAEQAAVGSTPIHSRQRCPVNSFQWTVISVRRAGRWERPLVPQPPSHQQLDLLVFPRRQSAIALPAETIGV